MSITQENEQRTHAEVPELNYSAEEGEEEIEARFIDRIVPFVVLLYPFSYFISTCQDFLRPHLPEMMSNLSVLVGIVGFLLAIGWLSKRLYRYRKARGWEGPRHT